LGKFTIPEDKKKRITVIIISILVAALIPFVFIYNITGKKQPNSNINGVYSDAEKIAVSSKQFGLIQSDEDQDYSTLTDEEREQLKYKAEWLVIQKQGNGITLAEWIAIQKQGGGVTPAEWIAMQQRGGGVTPAEWLAIQQRGGGVTPAEWLAIQQRGGGVTPAEWIAIQQGGGITPAEWIAIQQAGGVTPAEWIAIQQGGGGITPAEWIAIQQGGGVTPAEWIAIQQGGGITPIEWLAIQQVGGVTPTEWLAIQQGSSITPTEWLAIQQQGGNAALTEWLALREQGYSISATEWVALQQQGGNEALTEWLALREQGHSISATEWIAIQQLGGNEALTEWLALQQEGQTVSAAEWIAIQQQGGSAALTEWLVLRQQGQYVSAAEWIAIQQQLGRTFSASDWLDLQQRWGGITLAEWLAIQQQNGRRPFPIQPAPPPVKQIISGNMVLLNSGNFEMDIIINEQNPDDNIEFRQVTINSFYISKYEVTQREYENVMKNNPSYFKGPNLPVENVTWFDAIEYCNALSRQEGLTLAYTITGSGSDRVVTWNRNANGYRLPTEEEWVYACRASTTTPYNTGDSINRNLSNYFGRGTVNVGSYAPNNWGLYDMHGNVSEWCWNLFDNTNTENVTRIIRGGSWLSTSMRLRSSFRDHYYPQMRTMSIGFRVVMNYID